MRMNPLFYIVRKQKCLRRKMIEAKIFDIMKSPVDKNMQVQARTSEAPCNISRE
jgi:hypothetical protein